MISAPTEGEKHLIFEALVRMIKSNAGTGFHNSDQCHPAYLLGEIGKVDPVAGGDSPEQNELFKLLASFDQEFHDRGPDLSTWRKFCAFAVAAFKRANEPGGFGGQ